MLKLDTSRPYGTTKEVGKPDTYLQDGLRFDREGNPMDPKEVKAYYDAKVEAAEAAAEEARRVAEEATAEAAAMVEEATQGMKAFMKDTSVQKAPSTKKAAAKKSAKK